MAPPERAENKGKKRVRVQRAPAEWESQIATNGEGVPTKDAGNVAVTLMHDPAWRGAIAHDVISNESVIQRWPTGVTAVPRVMTDAALMRTPELGAVTDGHVLYIALWMRHRWSQSWSTEAVRAGIDYAARANPVDPLRSYLIGARVMWDGAERLDDWLTRYLGADDDAITRRIGRMWLLSAVARAMKPGAKVDYVLVLEGAQGAGKNRALELLFGDRWYLPELPDLRDKDAMVALACAWGACIDELRAIRAADVEKVKSFLSRRIDRYRPPYGRGMVAAQRRCVFAATTNAAQYLTDETGNRRYWAVRCGVIDHAGLARERDQLWGEAVAAYEAGEQWWPAESDRESLRAMQAEREQIDEWEHEVSDYVHGREWVTVGELLGQLGLERRDWTPLAQHRVARALTRLGWVASRQRIEGRPRRHWTLASSEDQSDATE